MTVPARPAGRAPTDPRLPRAQRIAKRQDRLIELAKEVAPLASKDLDDHDVRTILAAIVRRWSDTLTVQFKTEAVWSGAQSDLEHVVPVRAIVDRMVKKPRGVERVLREAVVVARVTPDEHTTLGPLRGHAEVYARMKVCRVDELADLGWQRYRDRGITVRDVDGRTPWRR